MQIVSRPSYKDGLWHVTTFVGPVGEVVVFESGAFDEWIDLADCLDYRRCMRQDPTAFAEDVTYYTILQYPGDEAEIDADYFDWSGVQHDMPEDWAMVQNA